MYLEENLCNKYTKCCKYRSGKLTGNDFIMYFKKNTFTIIVQIFSLKYIIKIIIINYWFVFKTIRHDNSRPPQMQA